MSGTDARKELTCPIPNKFPVLHWTPARRRLEAARLDVIVRDYVMSRFYEFCGPNELLRIERWCNDMLYDELTGKYGIGACPRLILLVENEAVKAEYLYEGRTYRTVREWMAAFHGGGERP